MFDESKHPRDKDGKFTDRTKAKITPRKQLEVAGYTTNGMSDEWCSYLLDILPNATKLSDILLGKSVGAKGLNYEVMDLSTGEYFNFVEGSKIQNVEVFCGAGTRIVYRNAYKYADKIGGFPEEWQHVKGYGLLNTPEGHRRAEIHWTQHKLYGKFDFFVKEWID